VAQLVDAIAPQPGRSRVRFPMGSLGFLLNNFGRTVILGSTD
jgi:hypothetical protein